MFNIVSIFCTFSVFLLKRVFFFLINTYLKKQTFTFKLLLFRWKTCNNFFIDKKQSLCNQNTYLKRKQKNKSLAFNNLFRLKTTEPSFKHK